MLLGLTGPLGQRALALAAQQPDPHAPAAVLRLRREVGAELAAAALQQEVLRRRARVKFGPAAAQLFFTSDGLEQASRPEVAAHRAARLAATGVRTVVDLGCGIGADALALARTGLTVVAVERDPLTAAVARLNLADRGTVRTGTAADLAPELLGEGLGGQDTAAFCDPARRDAHRRLHDAEEFSPGWDFVTALLAREGPTAVKLGPALPHARLPAGVEAEWVTHRGETVEVCLYGGTGAHRDTRTATLLPSGEQLRVPADERSRRAPVGPIGGWLHEPAGAVIRAGAVAVLAERLRAHLVDAQIAYLSSDHVVDSPFVESFRVLEVLPWREKIVRGWLRTHGIGRLEIKKRGLEVDPAALRRRLKPSGEGEATLLLTRTPDGARAVMAERLG